MKRVFLILATLAVAAFTGSAAPADCACADCGGKCCPCACEAGCC